MILIAFLILHFASLSLQDEISWIDATTVEWAKLPSYRAPDAYRSDCFKAQHCNTDRLYLARYHSDDGHGVAQWSLDNGYFLLDRGTVIHAHPDIRKEGYTSGNITYRAFQKLVSDLKLEYLNYSQPSISWVLASGDDLPLATLVASGWLNDGSVVYPCRTFHKVADSNNDHLILGRYIAGPGKKRSGGCLIYAPGSRVTKDTVLNFVLMKTYEVMQINMFGLTKERKRLVYTTRDYCPGNLCDASTMKG